MTEIHWSKANRSRHYGPKGYGILSYKPDLDPTDYIDGMSFNETNRKACEEVLVDDFSRLLRNEHLDGIPYGQLADMTSNNTIADAAMLNDVIWALFQSRNFDVQCPSGREKRTRLFKADDIILPRKQLLISGFGADTPPPRKA